MADLPWLTARQVVPRALRSIEELRWSGQDERSCDVSSLLYADDLDQPGNAEDNSDARCAAFPRLTARECDFIFVTDRLRRRGERHESKQFHQTVTLAVRARLRCLFVPILTNLYRTAES